jgi:Large polyvalent protein associated domain 29
MAYISADDVAAIRKELKAAFPGWKFGVRKGSGSLSVDVTILQGDVDFSENLQNGYTQVNQYWINDHWASLEARAALNRINEIMHNAPGRADASRKYFDHSDAMTDYFHTAFYTHLSIGAWNKNYALVK